MFINLLHTRIKKGVVMSKELFFLSLFIFIMSKNVCFGHGVHYEKIEGGIGIEANYDDGTPMSYSEVKVYSLQDKETEFQQGLTDKNGRFVFFPDVKGKWKLVVNDGMGHGIVTNISFEEEMKVKKTGTAHFSRWQKILIGVSLIFGITGILFYLVAKKRYRI